MFSAIPLNDRVVTLKRLHATWTEDYSREVRRNPDLARHLADALDDLQLLIRSFEQFESWPEAPAPRERRSA